MKKRMCAVLCALALAVCLLPVPAAQAAAEASDAQTYLDILNRAQPTNSYLIDFDGDGRDELVTADTSSYFVRYSVYQGDRNLTTKELLGLELVEVCTKDGKAYVSTTVADAGGGSAVYATVENGQWVQKEVFSSGGDPEDDASFSYWINDSEVSLERFLAGQEQYQTLFSMETDSSGDVRPELEAIVQVERLKNASPEEILARMDYLGERSHCRMTVEQATAYADALDGWNTRRYEQPYRELRHSSVRASLCDVEGNGIPALILRSVVIFEQEVGLDTFEPPECHCYEDVLLCNGNDVVLLGTPEYNREMWDMGSTQELSFGRNTWGGFSWVEHPITTRDEDCEYAIYTVRNGKMEKNDYIVHGNDLSSLYSAGYPLDKEVHDADYENGQSLSVLSTLLRAYAAADHAPSYPLFPDILGTGWETEPVAAAREAVSGEVTACYSLTDGMCYVVLKTADGYQGVLVQANRQRGKVVWLAVRVDAQPAAQEDLALRANQFLSTSNLPLNFDLLRQSPTVESLTDYLRSALEDMVGKAPNDLAKSDLAAFVDSAVTTLATQSVTGRKNRLTVDGDLLTGLSQQGREVMDALLGVLRDNSVELNRAVAPRLRMVWSEVDWSQPCQVDWTVRAAEALTDGEARVILGSAGTYVQLTAADLRALAGTLGGLSVQLSQEGEGVYAIRFLDGQGNVVDRLERPVTISLPASGELSTIMIRYTGGSDNWGGQYDPATGAISFEARYSGQYEVLSNSVELLDVDGLSDESKAAIAFMVSKGYLSAPDGLFRPGDSLNRYEFTQALVGMFFALDRGLTTDFPDVPGNSEYYAYVASAQARGIVNGYSDGTFSGADPINREQVFALAARTLIDQKGYAQPTEIEDYLFTFQDRGDVSDWAAPLVAMAVRDGVASRGDTLLPKANVTREQAAVILYRLFQLLYEVSPVALDVPGTGGLDGVDVAIIVLSVCAVALLAVIITVVVVERKKSRKKTAAAVPSTAEPPAAAVPEQNESDGAPQ